MATRSRAELDKAQPYVLTINELADYDDIATALVVDPYLGKQTHKMKKFPPNEKLWHKLRETIVKHRSDSVKTFDLIKHFIPQLPDWHNNDLDTFLAENKLPCLPTTEIFLDNERKELQNRFRALTCYTPREHRLLKEHVLRFLNVLDPAKSGLDISLCDRYSNDEKYACGAKVLSLRKFQKGETLKYLTGVVASEKKHRRSRASGRFNNERQNQGQGSSGSSSSHNPQPSDQTSQASTSTAIIPGVNDFSVTISCRTKDHQLWLGPAAYMNHDCVPNCKLRATGTTNRSSAVYEIIQDVEPGQEIFIHYGNNFFGVDNCQCECQTCELRKRGHFMSKSARSKYERDKSSRSNSVCGSSNSETNPFLAPPNFSVRIGKYSLRQGSRADRKN